MHLLGGTPWSPPSPTNTMSQLLRNGNLTLSLQVLLEKSFHKDSVKFKRQKFTETKISYPIVKVYLPFTLEEVSTVVLYWKLGLLRAPGLPRGLGELRNPGEWRGERKPFTVGEWLIRKPGEVFSTGEPLIWKAEEALLSKEEVLVRNAGEEDFSTGERKGEDRGLVTLNPYGLGLWELTGELTCRGEFTLLKAECRWLSVKNQKATFNIFLILQLKLK